MWNSAFKQKSFLIKFLLSFVVLAFLMTWMGFFFAYIEAREGFIFYDPILNFLHPIDVSNFIFLFTYGSIVIGLIYTVRSPYFVLHFCQFYILMNVFRVACMFAIPMEPPSDIIPLNDVILQSTVYKGKINVKDLFYSGHTATLFLFFFFVKNNWLKLFFFVMGTAVAVALMWQHVHYCYDVFAAPFFAFLSIKLVIRFSKILPEIK